MNKQTIITLAFLSALLLVVSHVFAGAPPPPPPPPLGIPVDSGAIALLVAGAAIGGKKLWDRRKNNDVTED